MEIKNKLGLWSIVLLGINNVIGSSIYLMPGQAYQYMGVNSLWVYVVDTVLALAIALCYAEAGGMFDKTGGPYIYAKEAFGEFVAFEVGIMKWASGIISAAAVLVMFAEAFSTLFPFFEDIMYRKILAISIVLILSIVNIIGVDFAKYLNNFMTATKLLPLIIFISLGVFFINGSNFDLVTTSSVLNKNFIPAMLFLFFAFLGFESIAVAAEDMENPKRNVPIAIIITIFVSSLLYILVQIVSIGTLGPLLSSTKAPVADAASKFLGNFGGILIKVGTLVSIFGLNIADSFITPRCGSALSEHGIIPKIVSKNSRFGTPYVAIIITSSILIPLILWGDLVQLILVSIISKFTEYIPTSISIPILRRKRGEYNKDGFKLPFGPVIPIISVIMSVAILGFYSMEKDGMIGLELGLGGMIIAIPIYLFMKNMNKKRYNNPNCKSTP